MAEQQIRFEDGAAYERMMGTWSRLVGNIFLDWLSPQPEQRWIDVGCGNGAFTELLVERHAPAEVHGVDPSEGQLAYARSRSCGSVAEFHQGNAMDLPFSDNKFDAAVMALVIFFVPDPAKCLAEMTRVVGHGGSVSTYVWDVFEGGMPMEPIQAELRAMGTTPPLPPSSDASRMGKLVDLWAGAGLDGIDTEVIAVRRTFDDFDDFWTTTLSSSLGGVVAAMAPDDAATLKIRVRERLSPGASGHVSYESLANAITGRVSK